MIKVKKLKISAFFILALKNENSRGFSSLLFAAAGKK